MQFLMLVCRDTEPVPAAALEGVDVPDIEEWVERHDSAGTRLLGDAVRPQALAKAVRVRGGKVLVTDGPYAETKEILCGFDVLECADMDEAIQVAAAHPMAYRGVLDIRPLLGD
ncbi:MAG TPA: YciI family protein [Mycobacteriales bacterium]|nr:YciI family protein [Mycobacteriales bacterium]